MEQEKSKLGLVNFLSELRLYICNEWVASFPSHEFRIFFYRKVMKFKIGEGSSIHMHCKFDCAKGFVLGANSVINQHCRLDNRGGLTIGDSVSVSEEVVILTADHDPDHKFFGGGCKPVLIADYGWIGTRATILSGVKLGKGAVVAAGAVVVNAVDEYTIVGGVPAKPIKVRKKDLDYKLSYRRLFQ